MPKRNTYGVKRRGDRWTACPWIPGQDRHVWVGTFDSEAEATKAAIEKIEELRKLPPHLETVETFAQRWVRDFPRAKESTNDRYRSDALRFAKYIGPAKKLNEVSVPEARTYAQAHPHDIGALRAMFSDARRDGLVLENPFSELRVSKGRGRKEIIVVTAEELGTLVELARRVHGDFGSTFAAILTFGAHTGLRPGEIFGLDWPDVDFEEEQVHVRRQYHKRRLTLPKSGHKRTVFLPPPAAQALRAMPRSIGRKMMESGHPGLHGMEHVFCGKVDQRITQSALSGYWKPVRTAFEATLSESRLMDFQREKGSLDFYAVTRHYCATSLIEQGVPSWIVAKQLGHEDGGRLVETIYGHPSDRVARERLRQAFGQNVEPLRAVGGTG